MTQKDLFQNQSESSQRATHVSPSQPQGKGEVKKTLATSSRTYLGLLHKQDRLLPFLKMFMDTSLWAWTRYSMEWKVKATPSGRLLCQLAVSAPAINETESGYWATPNTMDHLPQRSPEALLKQAKQARKGRKRPANLREQVDPETVALWEQAQEPKMWRTPAASNAKQGPKSKEFYLHCKKTGQSMITLVDEVKMFPTPTTQEIHHKDVTLTENGRRLSKDGKSSHSLNLADTVTMFPTPRASEYKDTGPVGSKSHTHMKGKKYLCAVVKDPAQPNGLLNPVWVEWLMGYPLGWTELED